VGAGERRRGKAAAEAAALTHRDLVERAGRWLRGHGCSVVFLEHTGLNDHPDALGYRIGHSHLIECKRTRSDFFADQKKPSRRLMKELGTAFRPAWKCWYMTPPGLLEPREIPAGWGLLEVHGRCIRETVFAPKNYNARDATILNKEIARLALEIRRYQAQGLYYKPYAQFEHERRLRLSQR
jgi:hypothetical protein